MKKVILIIMMLFLSINIYCQTTSTVVREGNTFSKSITKSNSTPEKTPYIWKDSKGKEYPIYISATGSCYVIRISNKTGKEYKQYMSTEISAQICKEMGREYKSKTNSDKKL